MLTETATVIAIDEDGLWVETLKQSVCGACSAKSGCGQHLLANYMRDMSCVKAKFSDPVVKRIWKLGDQVVIGIDEKALVVNAMLSYIFPLICLLLFAGLAKQFFLADSIVAVFGVLGLISSSMLIKFFYSRMRQQISPALDVVVLD